MLAVMGGVMIVQACCEMRKMPVVRCAAALTDAYLPLLPLACTSQRAARDKEDQERLKELALLRRLSLVENAGSLLACWPFQNPFLSPTVTSTLTPTSSYWHHPLPEDI